MTETPSPSPYDLAEQAAAALAEKTGVERHDVALVLGSGWLPAVDALGEATAEIATTDLPGYSAAAVELGAEVLHEPRLWPEYHDQYFGGYVRDTEGNNVEAVCHTGDTPA